MIRFRRPRRGEAHPPAPFVVGVARSGTTLLRMMLDAHPELTIPPETHFIPRLIKVCEGAGDDGPELALETLTTHRRWPDFGLDADELRADLEALDPFTVGDALRAFYGAYAARQGKPRWGDKSPGYVRRMRRIASVLPEARFVHLIRDGRDVALSQLEVHHGADSVREAGEAWVTGIEKARRNARRVEHYMEASYEDLVADPEPVLRAVCEFVELPYDEAMLSYHERAADRMAETVRELERHGREAIPAEVRARQHSRVSSPPQAQRAGRWRTDMAPEDRELFEEVAGEMLVELGYDVGGA